MFNWGSAKSSHSSGDIQVKTTSSSGSATAQKWKKLFRQKSFACRL
jgi:hypothetical protein